MAARGSLGCGACDMGTPAAILFRAPRRIQNARRKLDGFSPVALLVVGLKQNPAVDKFNSLAALEAILRRG